MSQSVQRDMCMQPQAEATTASSISVLEMRNVNNDKYHLPLYDISGTTDTIPPTAVRYIWHDGHNTTYRCTIYLARRTQYHLPLYDISGTADTIPPTAVRYLWHGRHNIIYYAIFRWLPVAPMIILIPEQGPAGHVMNSIFLFTDRFAQVIHVTVSRVR